MTSGLIFSLSFSPLAQAIMGSSTNYQLESADFTNGGGSGSSTNYNLDAAVIGDNADGSIISHNYQICSGLVQETFATCDDPAPPAPPDPPEPPEPPIPTPPNIPPTTGAGGEFGDDPIGNYPSNPSEPENPTQPTNPENPNNPQNPSEPSNPNQPDQPTQPGNPDQPGSTSNPQNPTQSIRPVAPEFPNSPNEILGEFTSAAQAIIEFLSNPENLINAPFTLEILILSNQDNLFFTHVLPAVIFIIPINTFYRDLIWPNVFFNNSICFHQSRCFFDLIVLNNVNLAPLDTTIYSLSNQDLILITILTTTLVVLVGAYYFYWLNGLSQLVNLKPMVKKKRYSKKR